MRTMLVAALAAGTIAAAASAQSMTEPPPLAGPCDRTCLNGYIDRYLDAMLANEVDPDLFARDVKFTENGIRLPLGDEGLWFGMSGKGTYEFYVPDVETQQVAFIGTVREDMANRGEGTKVAVAIRLKIVDGLITEVEQLAIRPPVNLFPVENAPPPRFPPTGEAVEAMGSPNPIFAEIIPEAERPSREELIRTANYYFTGLSRNDGMGYYPFTDDCVRYENGIETTRECKKQFEENLKGVISRVRDRRFVAVDRETGIVFSFAFFDHEQINWTWQLAELFKIENGQIRRIEAVFHQAPYGIPSGWSTYEQSISEEIQSVR